MTSGKRFFTQEKDLQGSWSSLGGGSVATGPPGWINLSPQAGALGVCTALGSRAAVCAQGVFCRRKWRHWYSHGFIRGFFGGKWASISEWWQRRGPIPTSGVLRAAQLMELSDSFAFHQLLFMCHSCSGLSCRKWLQWPDCKGQLAVNLKSPRS